MSTWWDGIRSQFESKEIHKDLKWLNDFQTQSFAEFEQLGLPHAKQDNWRATPVRQLFSDGFVQHAKDVSISKCQPPTQSIYVAVKGHQTEIDASSLPQGVSVMPIFEAAAKLPELMNEYMGKVATHQHGLLALNSAFFDTGIVVHIAQGTNLDQPIFIHHQLADGNITHTRHLFILEANSSATFVEYFDGGSEKSAMMNHVSEMILHHGAQAQHYKVQQLGLHGKLQSHGFVRQHPESHLQSFMLQLGGALSNCDMDVDLEGAHAKVNLIGLFMPSKQQFHQQRVHVNHMVPDCQSEQDFKGVLDDKAQAVFLGKVTVAKGAVQTQAHQSNKNLLLAKTAQVTTAPQLQIYADDVVCSHGATVGQLDEDALFYLRSRGFEERQAKDMLIHAFIKAQIDVIEDQSLRDWFLQQIDQK